MKATPSTSTLNPEALSPETFAQVASLLEPGDLTNLAISSLHNYALCHSRALRDEVGSRLRSRRISWTISGPALADYTLSFFRYLPQTSTRSLTHRLDADLEVYQQGGSALQQGHPRRCLQGRWISPTDGQKLLQRAIQSGELESIDALLSSGIFPEASTLMDAIRQRRADLVRRLIDAGARPTTAHIQAGYQQRGSDKGVMFVALLRGTFVAVDLGELEIDPQERIPSIDHLQDQPEPTYWDFALKADFFLTELHALMTRPISTPPDLKDIETLGEHICEGSPLSPALSICLTQSSSEAVTLNIVEYLLSQRAKVTSSVLESGLRTGSPQCITLLLDQEGAVVTPWMLERSIVLLRSQTGLLRQLVQKCPQPSQLSLELAIDHAPRLIPNLLSKIERPPSLRVLAKAICYLTQAEWPEAWTPASWHLTREQRLQLMELACLWQPKNTPLIDGLLRGIPPEPEFVRRPFIRALRLRRVSLLQTFFKHCPQIARIIADVLKKTHHDAATTIQTLQQIGLELDKQPLTDALKSRPLNNELILFLLKSGSPVTQEQFAKVAKMGSPEVISEFRRRGVELTHFILERGFRRQPFDPAVIRALLSGEGAKWASACESLISFPVRELNRRDPSRVSVREVLNLFSLLAQTASSPPKSKANQEKGSRKGKERTGPSISSTPTPQASPIKTDLPKVVINYLLRLIGQWPDDKVREFLRQAEADCHRLLFERAATKTNDALLRKLMRCGLPTNEKTFQFLLIERHTDVLQLLLTQGHLPPPRFVLDLVQREGMESTNAARFLSAARLASRWQADLLTQALLNLSQKSGHPKSQGLRLKILEKLIKSGIQPQPINLEVAAALPLSIAPEVLQLLLSVWDKPLPAGVVVKLAGQKEKEAQQLTDYLLVRYSASGGDRPSLLNTAIELGSEEALCALKKLLHMEVKPTDKTLVQAVKSRSDRAPDFLEALLKRGAVPNTACFDALAQCRSSQAPRVAAILFTQPGAPSQLSKHWMRQLLVNPSPHAGALLKTILERGISVKGLDQEMLQVAIESRLDSASEIVRVLLSHVEAPDLLPKAAANPTQGLKIAQILLERGAKVTQSALWAARHNGQTHFLLYRQLVNQQPERARSPANIQTSISISPSTSAIPLFSSNTALGPIFQAPTADSPHEHLINGNSDVTRVLQETDGGNLVQHVRLGEGISDLVIKTLAESCPKLQTIGLNQFLSQSQFKVTDEGVKSLAQNCPELKSIELNYTKNITDAGITALAQGCPQLQKVALKWASFLLTQPVTDVGVKALAAACHGLQEIDLPGCGNLSDAAVVSLAEGCPQLQRVTLPMLCHRITNEGVKALARHCHLLTEVRISSDAITDDGITDLGAQCHQLRTVGLSFCSQVTLRGIKALAEKCPLSWIDTSHTNTLEEDLEALEAEYPEINFYRSSSDAQTFGNMFSNSLGAGSLASGSADSSLASPFSLTTPTSLFAPQAGPSSVSSSVFQAPSTAFSSLFGSSTTTSSFELTRIDNDSDVTRILQETDSGSQLRHVRLGSDVTDAGIKALAHCDELLTIDLSWCKNISDVGIKALVAGCSLLQKANFSFTPKVTDEAIQALASACPQLQVVDLAGCSRVTDKGVSALAAGCRLLQKVNFSFGPKVTNGAIQALAVKCAGLQEIDLSGCRKVSDKGVIALATGCSQLQAALLYQCSLTNKGLKSLANHCSQLRKLSASSDAITDEGVTALAIQCPQLQNLNLSSCFQVTLKGIQALARRCQLLKININDTNVSQREVNALRSEYPEIEFEYTKEDEHPISPTITSPDSPPSLFAASSPFGDPSAASSSTKSNLKPSASPSFFDGWGTTLSSDVQDVGSQTPASTSAFIFGSSVSSEQRSVASTPATPSLFGSASPFEFPVGSPSTSSSSFQPLEIATANLFETTAAASSSNGSMKIDSDSDVIRVLEETDGGRQLRDVSLGSDVTDAGLKTLAEGCAQLQEVRFLPSIIPGIQAKVTDDGIQALASNCYELRTVSLTRCNRVTDVGIIALASACQQLQSVLLSGCKKITIKGVKALAAKNQLWRIEIPKINVTEQELGSLTAEYPEFRLQYTNFTVLLVRTTTPSRIRSAASPSTVFSFDSQTFGSTSSKPFGALTNTGSPDDPVFGAQSSAITSLFAFCSAEPLGSQASSSTDSEDSQTISDDTDVVHALKKTHDGRRMRSVTFGREITDVGIKTLAESCPKLQNMSLTSAIYGSSKLTDEGVKALARNCHELKSVDLSSCKDVSDQGIKALAAECPQLREINLAGCKRVTDKGLTAIALRCSQLQKVELYPSLFGSPHVTDQGIKTLARNCHALQSVNLCSCTRITDEGIQALAAECRQLRKLDFVGCNRITDESLTALASGCHQLQEISFSESNQVTNEGLIALASKCRQLRRVELFSSSLFGISSVTDEGIKAFGRSCHELREINLAGCELITDESLIVLASECHQLQSVRVPGCKKVTIKGIKALVAKSQLSKIEIPKGSATERDLRSLVAEYPQISLQYTSSNVLLMRPGAPFGDRFAASPSTVFSSDSQTFGSTSSNLFGSPASASSSTTEASPPTTPPSTSFSITCATDEEVDDLSASSHPLLREVKLEHEVTDEGVMNLALRISSLRNLNLSGCTHVTNRGLFALAARCSLLEEVNLKATLITRIGVEALAVGCSQLRRINVEETALSPTELTTLRAIHSTCTFQKAEEAPQPSPSEPSTSAAPSSPQPPKKPTISFNPLGIRSSSATFYSDEEIEQDKERLPQLKEVTLGHNVSDEAVKLLAEGCPDLLRIFLGESVTDEGVKALAANCPHLQEINLCLSPKISEQGIRALASSCSKLEVIFLNKSATNSGISALAKGCPQLRKVDLNFCRDVTDEGLRALATSCQELREIHLWNCERITHLGIRALMDGCKQLKIVKFAGTRVSKSHLQALRSTHQQCRFITPKQEAKLLDGAPGKGPRGRSKGKERLGREPRATLPTTGGTGSPLPHKKPTGSPPPAPSTSSAIPTDVAVKKVALTSDEEVLKRIASCPPLQQIELGGAVTDKGFQALIEKWPDLLHVDLAACSDVTDEALREYLTRCHKLQIVSFGRTKVTDETLIALAKACPELRKIAFGHRNHVTDVGIKALAKGCPNLELIELSGTEATDEAVKILASKCQRLLRVQFSYRMTEGAITSLAVGCPQLRSVDLPSSMTDEGVKALAARCPNLKQVWLQGSIVSDDSVSALAMGCPKLRKIKLHSCEEITDVSAKALGLHCRGLQDVDFTFTKVSDDGLQALAQGCHQLKRVEFAGSKVTKKGQEALKAAHPACQTSGATFGRLFGDDLVASASTGSESILDDSCVKRILEGPDGGKQLRAVDISSGVTDTGLKALVASCPQLLKVMINNYGGSAVTDEGIQALASCCHELQIIDLSDNKTITDKSIVALAAECRQLKEVNLSNCRRVTDESLKALAVGCPNLQKANFYYTKATDAGVQALAAACHQLQEIDLLGCQEVSDTGVIVLAAGSPRLQLINLLGTSVSDWGLKAIARHCPQLKEIRVGNSSKLTDAGIIAIAARCHRLQRVDLSSYRNLTDAGVKALARNCPRLKSIDLEDCEHVTNEGLIALASSCRQLQDINLSGCEQITLKGVQELASRCPLKKINLENTNLSYEDISALEAAYPKIEFDY